MTLTSERSELALRGQRRDPRPLPRRRRDRSLYRGSEESRGQRGYVLIEMLDLDRHRRRARRRARAVRHRGARGGHRPVRRRGPAAAAARRDRRAPPRSAGRRGRSTRRQARRRRSEAVAIVDFFAPILPARIGCPARIRSCRTTPTVSASRTSPTRDRRRHCAPGMAGPESPLAIDVTAPGCPAGGSCGFARGDRALVFSREAHDVFTVRDAGGGTVSPSAPLSHAYPAGSRVVGIVHRVYYLDRPGKRLMVYDGDRSDMPLVDHVVDLRFSVLCRSGGSRCSPAAPRYRSCAYAPGDPPVPLLDELGGSAPGPRGAGAADRRTGLRRGAASLRRRPAARAPDRCHHTSGDRGRGAPRLRSRVPRRPAVPSEGAGTSRTSRSPSRSPRATWRGAETNGPWSAAMAHSSTAVGRLSAGQLQIVRSFG